MEVDLDVFSRRIHKWRNQPHVFRQPRSSLDVSPAQWIPVTTTIGDQPRSFWFLKGVSKRNHWA